MSTLITPHFSKEVCEHSDYAIAHHIPNTIPDNLMPNGIRLCTFMEEIRSFLSGHYNQEVKIIPSSIYRGPDLNTAIKGQPTSQHMRFEAMDYHTSIGDIEEVFDLIAESDLEFDQLILEHDSQGHIWLHTSVPNDGVKARRDILKGEKGKRLNRIAVS